MTGAAASIYKLVAFVYGIGIWTFSWPRISDWLSAQLTHWLNDWLTDWQSRLTQLTKQLALWLWFWFRCLPWLSVYEYVVKCKNHFLSKQTDRQTNKQITRRTYQESPPLSYFSFGLKCNNQSNKLPNKMIRALSIKPKRVVDICMKFLLFLFLFLFFMLLFKMISCDFVANVSHYCVIFI